MDRTISIDQSIDPNSSLKINPIDYDLELGKHLYIEVSSENRCSRMELGTADGTHDFMAPIIPPLIMWWERSVWGGSILKLSCVEGNIPNVVVYKHNGAGSRPVFLRANAEPTSIDGSKFNDSKPLLENEIFKIESAGYPNIIGIIPHHKPVSNTVENVQNQYPDILDRIKPWMAWIGVLILLGMIRGCSK